MKLNIRSVNDNISFSYMCFKGMFTYREMVIILYLNWVVWGRALAEIRKNGKSGAQLDQQRILILRNGALW